MPSLTRPASERRVRGFSLLELLVVVVIIGLLASYVGPRLFGHISKSERESARMQIDALTKALAAYRIDTGRFPSQRAGLDALVQRPDDEPRWRGPYLEKQVPRDPWGRPYRYLSPGEHGEVDVLSYGKDGQRGGSGDDADVVSWE